jgi:hypothetical protein
LFLHLSLDHDSFQPDRILQRVGDALGRGDISDVYTQHVNWVSSGNAGSIVIIQLCTNFGNRFSLLSVEFKVLFAGVPNEKET